MEISHIRCMLENFHVHTILNKVTYILNTKSIYALYCAQILPHLTYCDEVWVNNCNTNLMSLYLLKKRQFVLFVKVIS